MFRNIILVGFLILNIGSILAQESTINAMYDYSFKLGKDGQMEFAEKETMVLVSNGESSIFTSLIRVENLGKFKSQMKTGSISMQGMTKARINFEVDKSISSQEINYYERFLGKSIMNDEKFPSGKWKIHSDTLTINNLICRKATIEYAGRNWFAWYSEDIPIADGPYKFCGLPGLILELKDSESHHVFSLKTILDEVQYEFGDVEFENKAGFQKLTLNKLIEFRKRASENAFALLTKNSQIPLPAISPEQKKRFNERKKRESNFIELSAD